MSILLSRTNVFLTGIAARTTGNAHKFFKAIPDGHSLVPTTTVHVVSLTVYCLACLRKKATQKGVRKRIFAPPSDIFPDGKVIYSRWKCDILLCKVILHLQGSCGVGFADIFKYTFSKKIYHNASYITRRKPYITDLQRKSISLWVGHIPMPNPLTGNVIMVLSALIK